MAVKVKDEPAVPAIAFEKVRGGWVVVSMLVEGNSVTAREVHGEPLPLDLAARQLKATVLAELVNRNLPLLAVRKP